MKNEILYLVLTFEGDRMRQLKRRSETRTPVRLNPAGDTEAIVTVWLAEASLDIPALEFVKLLEPDILAEASKVGRVVSHRWLIRHDKKKRR